MTVNELIEALNRVKDKDKQVLVDSDEYLIMVDDVQERPKHVFLMQPR